MTRIVTGLCYWPFIISSICSEYPRYTSNGDLSLRSFYINIIKTLDTNIDSFRQFTSSESDGNGKIKALCITTYPWYGFSNQVIMGRGGDIGHRNFLWELFCLRLYTIRERKSYFLTALIFIKAILWLEVPVGSGWYEFWYTIPWRFTIKLAGKRHLEIVLFIFRWQNLEWYVTPCEEPRG